MERNPGEAPGGVGVEEGEEEQAAVVVVVVDGEEAGVDGEEAGEDGEEDGGVDHGEEDQQQEEEEEGREVAVVLGKEGQETIKEVSSVFHFIYPVINFKEMKLIMYF